MKHRSWGSRLGAILLLLILTAFNCLAQTTVFFDVQSVFTTQPPYNTNRVFRLQALSPFAGSYFYRTSDVAGQFYVSNTLATTYSGLMLAPPNSVTFSFSIVNTNQGVIPAQGITSIPANGVQTFPAGQTAWSIQASDSRYAFSTNGSSAGINASQATNIAVGLISASNSNYSPLVFTNVTQVLYTNALPGLTNGHVTASITNGLASVNLVNITSNGLVAQIGAAGISAVTATNIATNQVFLGTNGIGISSQLSAFRPTNTFDVAGAGTSAATLATNAAGIASGLSAYVSTNRWDTNGAGVLAANLATNSAGISSGLSAFVPTNRFTPEAEWLAGSNALQAQIVGGSVTANQVTNISSFLIGVSNAPLSASNSLLFVGKVDSTNGFSTGERATNFNVKGSIGLGDTGQATNIVNGTTNLVKFINAGSLQATNGVFIWTPSLGCYTNWITMAIWTNTGSGWVMITNGVDLYSLSGASPFGVSSTVSGSAPAPLAVPTFYLDHNGMQDVGFLSVTGLTSFVTNTVNMSASNAIANMNGLGTNTFLTNSVLTWNVASSVNSAQNGGTMNFQAMSAGVAQTNFGSGFGAAILSGSTNRLGQAGASVIVGGQNNFLGGGFNNYDFLGGGLSNVVGAVDGSFLGGGLQNAIGQNYAVLVGGQLNLNSSIWGSTIGGLRNTNAATGGVILGGTSNTVFGAWTTAGGRNAKMSNDNSWGWSDGFGLQGSTNAQFLIHATNGVGINTNFNGTNALAVNGNVDASGMSIQGTNLFALFGGGASFVTASNFLGLTKLNITNDTSYGQTASNLTLRGRTAFNQATNFIDTTNVIKFYQAGTSIVTNGAYEWVSAMNLYTNRSTTLVITNTGSQWIVLSSGAGVYSSATLVNNSWGAIGGSGNASSCNGFWQIEDGQVLLGWISSTNLNYQITNAVAQGGGGTSLSTITNIVNFVATNNYLKTNAGIARNASLFNSTNYGNSTWRDTVTPSASTLITSNSVFSTTVAADFISDFNQGHIELDSDTWLVEGEIDSGTGNVAIDSGGAYHGSLLVASNLPPSGISTNASTIGQVLANVGSGVVGFTNVSGSVGPSITTNLMVWTNQPTFTAGQAVVVTGTNSAGSLVLKTTNWPGSGGGLPANGLGALTNDSSGNLGYSTGMPWTWIIGGSNAVNASSNSLFSTMLTTISSTNNNVVTPAINSSSNLNYVNTLIAISATNNALPAQTNFWGVTNSITRGQAVVVDGTNSFGVWQLKGTNWPSGGGSQTPWASDIDAADFNLLDLNRLYWTNTITLNSSVAAFNTASGGDDGSVLSFIGRTNNASATTSLLADRLIAQSQVRVNGGSISVIPTNAAPITLVTNAPGTSLPMGLTNVFVGRAQPVIQYYVVDAVAGTPCMTISNENTGVKLIIGAGALTGLTTTNFATLPTTTTNSIWRVRDESGGSGASVGIITNWLIGL